MDEPDSGAPVYLSGLRLAGRDVLVVGAGHVAERRIPRLLAAGARVRVVAPEATDPVAALAAAGQVTWLQRTWEPGDGDPAWYVLALTDQPAVNAAVAAEAEARRTFCVRGDDAVLGTAYTPATADAGGLSVGVVGDRNPRRSARVRDALLHSLREGPDGASLLPRPTPGTVTLVGGGPGDPGLITVAGRRAVQAADVILYDRLAPLPVLDDARPDALRIPVGKAPNGPFVPQERINDLLVEHARAGRAVVRLKGGDNFVFGRGGEEWQFCAEHGVPVHVIPGVTSSVAGPALAGIPVTHRSLVQGFTVVSGHVAPGDPRSTVDWEQLARTGTTLVILMGVAQIGSISEALVRGGLRASTPVAVIADASHPSMRVLRSSLDGVAAAMRTADIQPPALVVVGEVAGLDFDEARPEAQ